MQICYEYVNEYSLNIRQTIMLSVRCFFITSMVAGKLRHYIIYLIVCVCACVRAGEHDGVECRVISADGTRRRVSTATYV